MSDARYAPGSYVSVYVGILKGEVVSADPSREHVEQQLKAAIEQHNDDRTTAFIAQVCDVIKTRKEFSHITVKPTADINGVFKP